MRQRTDILDAVGNTTAATGKGFAIASAALTSLALFAAFMGIANIDRIDISTARVLGGLLAGTTVSGVLMAMFQSNAGGAWDNAKKSFESGVVADVHRRAGHRATRRGGARGRRRRWRRGRP